MANSSPAAQAASNSIAHEETHSLLSSDSDDLVILPRPTLTPSPGHSASPDPIPLFRLAPRRQSSFAQPRPDGAPRTPNRVQFNDAPAIHTLTPRNSTSWMDEDDFLGRRDDSEEGEGVRLLRDMEPGAVTAASADVGFSRQHLLLESARPKSGMSSAFMNMANSIIGAGIIGQPYAFRQAGLFTGVFLLVVLTFVVDWTIQLIVINSKMSGTDSFQGTVQHCFGQAGLIAISIAQWAFAFGGMLAFCIIIGDTIPTVFRAMFPSLEDTEFLWLLTDRRAIIIMFVLGISFPLSMYRDIAKLAKASTLALISMLIIIVTVVTQVFFVPLELRGQLRGSLIINKGITEAIGVISFAFVCHHNSLLIYGSLRKPTLDRFAKVTHWSTGISCVACLILALVGYLTFGDKTDGNVLNNFPDDNIMVNIARLCFGLNMLTTLPLECFVCREVIFTYFYPSEPHQQTRHVATTSALVISAIALSLFTCDLGIVFELVGATSACALAYILPPLCYLKLSTRSWKSYAAAGCVVFGVAVMCITVFGAVAKMVDGSGTSKKCE
ncbi:amino acid transporter [Venturia nashicola]|uniref:Amino acid transporter n=1 Tax=Venturia nashicola TaxID=86259 RepID=A0A4Z1NEI8_9PEZI|nr:amino acid transporter [Venturia nashicola]